MENDDKRPKIPVHGQKSRSAARKRGLSQISPCIGTCQINPDTRLCEGCRRTLTEIAEWLQMDDARKRAVMADLARRDPFAGDNEKKA